MAQPQQQSNAMTVQQKDSYKRVTELIERAAPALEKMQTKYLKPERLVKIALSSFARQPEILECSAHSILIAIMQATEVGLEFGSAKREAYLIPRRNNALGGVMEATFLPSYVGLITVARRSGEVVDIESRVVHEKDEFEPDYGEGKLLHKPFRGLARGDVIAAWARAHWRDGYKKFEVMWVDEIDAIRKNFSHAQSKAWQDHYEEMAKKTVVRRLFKMLPKTDDFALAEAMDAGEDDPAERFRSVLGDVSKGIIDISHGAPTRQAQGQQRSGERGDRDPRDLRDDDRSSREPPPPRDRQPPPDAA